ncbi:MAG: GNAT family N-acetyltransferase [Roseobacter sp.]
MTPQAMADMHARAFAPERGWRAEEFASLVASPFVTCLSVGGGFALIRTVADETELLTLAVDPSHRRKGVATQLMQDWLTTVAAQSAYLEVASDNGAAMALYLKHGFAIVGRRAGYYARPDGPAVDAVLMQAALTHR